MMRTPHHPVMSHEWSPWLSIETTMMTTGAPPWLKKPPYGPIGIVNHWRCSNFVVPSVFRFGPYPFLRLSYNWWFVVEDEPWNPNMYLSKGLIMRVDEKHRLQKYQHERASARMRFFYANPSFQNNLFGKLEGLRVSFPLINYIPSRPIIYTPGIPHCIPHYIVVTLLCPPTKTTNIDRIEWFWNGSSWRAQQWKERIMANLRYPETNYVCI